MPFVFRKQASNDDWAALGPQYQGQPGLPQHPPQPRSQLASDNPARYPTRIQKLVDDAAKYDCQYLPTPEDIREIQFEKYKTVFGPATLVRNFLFLRRIQDPKDSSKEWLVWRYQDTVTDDAGEPHSHEYDGGFDVESVPTIKRNSLREIEDISFDKKRVHYQIPFSRAAVEEVLDTGHNVPTDLAIAYGGSEFGAGDPWHGSELTIWNLNDFKDRPFDTLERMNKEGYNRKDGTGYERMIKEEKEDAEEHGTSIAAAKTMNVQKATEQLKKAKAAQQLP